MIKTIIIIAIIMMIKIITIIVLTIIINRQFQPPDFSAGFTNERSVQDDSTSRY